MENERPKIQCLECGEYFYFINNTHLKLHNLTIQEYKEKYPDAIVKSRGGRKSHNNPEENVEDVPSDVTTENSNSSELDEEDVSSRKVYDYGDRDSIINKFRDLIKVPEPDPTFFENVPTTKESEVFYPVPKIEEPAPKLHVFNHTLPGKVRILNFLKNSYFPDLINNYKIEFVNKVGNVELQLVSDMASPAKRVVFNFPNTFWHNMNPRWTPHKKILISKGWRIVEVLDKAPSDDSIRKILKENKIILN